LQQIHKASRIKSLQTLQIVAYKSAYKKHSENGLRETSEKTRQMSPDLAEIVAAWPKLPEHIKAAIRALVSTSLSEYADD